MKNHKNSRWNVSEVAKKLGISFDELKAEFAECGIKARADDSFDKETIEYVLSGMYGEEFDRGTHLHLETGDVAGEIQRGAMRGNEGNEGDESGMIHELTVAGWAQKLGLDGGVLLNELRSQGHSIDIDDTIESEVVRYAIDSAEVYGSWETLSTEPQNETYERNSEYHISEMALKLGVPATALMSWLAYNGYNTEHMTDESKKAFDIAHKSGDINRGTSHTAGVICDECDTGCEHMAHGKRSAEYRTTYDVKEGVVASADPVEVEGIVASSDAAYAGGTNYTKTIARGLLGFLAIPLLFGLFGRNGGESSTNVVHNGPAEMSVHGVNDEQEKSVNKSIRQSDNQKEKETILNNVIVDEDTRTADILNEEVDVEPMQVQEFINNLVDDINIGMGGEEHEAALPTTLPTTLPKTGTN